ncbi:MAG TPA: L-2-hydroxyglutarate oxidase [Thermoleophilaceae bacterium]
MDPPADLDVAVVGAGIVGLAVARELLERMPGMRVGVLEREDEVAQGQTGRNSGVIHAGIYYAPGTLKARLCVEGAQALYDYCEACGIEARRCGKVIVAVDDSELPALDELERRGHANSVPGLRRLSASELREIEPHARGVAALHSPATGVVDFAEVARALARDVEKLGGTITTGCAVEAVEATGARFTVACAGAGASRLAVASGAPADPRVVPFRGSYMRLGSERAELVRSLIYPVPDPRLPFLGVHLSRHIEGEVMLGPTALLAGGLAWPGTWRVVKRHWRAGVAELRRAASRRALAADASRLVPGIEASDLEPGFTGVRAQAVGRDGRLIDDFVIDETPRALHVRNAPSPAATASLAIAREIADRVEAALG